eukprot:TRINITY_DN39677_c0_g1_i1.p1 TRINITY_DN39677_c0_g1~~TRINITY_DN39677_c0_g1_i1.p1  ORF type:complete len:335 (+),score=93.81 TRINITY_DN39677_c0_g1_i1:59-1063(+)
MPAHVHPNQVDEDLELGDDEPEPQIAVVDLPPPDVGQKIRDYVAAFQLGSDDRGSAVQALEQADQFQALRVMNMMFEPHQEPHVRLRLLRSRLRNQSNASSDASLHKRVTDFVRRWNIDERAEYAIRGLDDIAMLEVIDNGRYPMRLDGIDGGGCSRICMTRIKAARQRQREWQTALQHGEVEGQREPWSHPRAQGPLESVPGPKRRRVSPERRTDPADGNSYTKSEFVDCYGGYAQWDAATPVAATPEPPPPRKPRPKAPAPLRQMAADTGPFKDGASVVVQGLAGMQHLNGQMGTVRGRQGDRVIVEIPANGEKALRPENLAAADAVFSAVD